MKGRNERGLADLVLPVLLFAGTVLYVSLLPRNLGESDEAIYLYEAKRVLGGQVMYRDVFEIITPGWVYLMAFLFRVFGTDLVTARVATAVLHGGTGALLYLACRRLGIRRGLAWPPALGYLAVCASAWPVASQHWLATFVSVLLLWMLSAGRPDRASWTLLPGVVTGLLIAVQQPRGVVVAVGVAVWLVVDHLIARRYGRGAPWPTLAKQLATLAAGVSLVVAPLGVAMVASAGVEPVWRALVVHPLVSYRGTNHSAWGQVNVMTAWNGSFTFPRLLKYLPAILPVSALRLASLWTAGRDEARARRLALLVVSSLAAMASIAYFPDFIHIAFIAPAFLLMAAEMGEWAAGRVGRSPGVLRVAGAVAAVAFVLGCGLHLGWNMQRLRATFTVSRETAFGRIDYGNPTEVALYDRLVAVMRDAPSRALFCYPIIAKLYLTAGAENPTPYGFFIAGYSTPDQIQEVLDILERRKVEYVVVLPGFVAKDDPIITYVARHYEPVSSDDRIGLAIQRRKADRAT
jgi:hypothetical protein